MKRNIRLRIRPSAEAGEVLRETLRQYTHCFNAAARVGFDKGIYSGVALHHETYYSLRAETELPSQLVISARGKAVESLRAVRSLRMRRVKALADRSKGRNLSVPGLPSCPHSSQSSIRYDCRSYKICWDKCEARVVTVEGRKSLHFKVPEAKEALTRWDTGGAELCLDRQGRWWLNVAVYAEAPVVPETDEVLGVDLGIAVPAMDSRGRAYGNDHWKIVEDRYEEHRRALQSKGTRSAKRRLKKISGRQRRFRRDCDHVLSKQIVSSVSPGGVIAMEDLTDIRLRAASPKARRGALHGWSFAQLQGFIKYKAEARGVGFAKVSPGYTSQRCSKCQHCDKRNRRSRGQFKCLACGFECHADHNSAINIALDFRRT